MATKPRNGRWQKRKPAVEQWVYTSTSPSPGESTVESEADFEFQDKGASTSSTSKGSQSTEKSGKSRFQDISPSPPPHKPTILQYIFCCFISSRPKYTKIQHLVIPTAQVCVGRKALQFLQAISRDDYWRLRLIVQEVFTEDGVKRLGRISENDELIKAALKGQIRTERLPWRPQTRENYVEHVAGVYARLLRKLGVYDTSSSCQAIYRKAYKKQMRRTSA